MCKSYTYTHTRYVDMYIITDTYKTKQRRLGRQGLQPCWSSWAMCPTRLVVEASLCVAYSNKNLVERNPYSCGTPIQHLEKHLVSHSGNRSPFFFGLFLHTWSGTLRATVKGFEWSRCYSERCHPDSPDTLKIQLQPPAVAGPNSCEEQCRFSLLVIFLN